MTLRLVEAARRERQRRQEIEIASQVRRRQAAALGSRRDFVTEEAAL